ncbi:MAG: hypothetical protein J0H17_10430 [Rhizobiales bacterium]|nr:hypothetical protein [Hyphomicrobiales bacterium]
MERFAAFSPSDRAVMREAYEDAWAHLVKSDSSLVGPDIEAATKDALVLDIIAGMRAGVKDARSLRDHALANVGVHPE